MTSTATVGCVKPTRSSGSHADLKRLLPGGIATIAHRLDVRHGTVAEFEAVMAQYEDKVRILVEAGVDLVHPEGTPPFMLRGRDGEREIVAAWESRYGVPVFTSAMSQAEAMAALGIRRFVGVGYDFEDTGIVARYFEDAGFEVLALDRPGGVAWEEIDELDSGAVFDLVAGLAAKWPEAEGIYIQGSKWRVLDIVARLEDALRLPVVHPITARCWAIQKRLGIERPQGGYGRLLAELPPLRAGAA